ncbi:hypothetical protein FACS189449_06990 [Alphaproteobacteria bacterium]|nr:hypothetical protein FACS189449_06990 [Alphaproteobacteria bacterium]
MKTILLTGATGFIGRNIAESYLSDKYEIYAPSRAELDIADTESVNDFFARKAFDAVIHCATKPGHRNAKDHSNLFYTNTRMFFNLERHKNKYGKFINCGSGAVYDINTNISNASEEDLFKNLGKDDHSFCKYVVSKHIQNIPNFVDLNIFGIFGKYEDYEIRFISNAICKTLFGLPITLRQNRRFSYLYIDDLYHILEFFIENNVKHRSYNVVPDAAVTLYDLAVLVRDISGKDVPISVAREGFGLDYYGSNSRLQTEFSALHFIDIDSAIKQLYTSYRKIKNSLISDSFLLDK